MNSPLLSICIPTYNRAKFLDIGLKAITDQLTSKELLDKVEIIISDNNSSDDTEKIIHKYQIKLFNIRFYKNKENIGGDNNMKKVTTYARGKYLWLLGSDDFVLPNSLTKIISNIEKFRPKIIVNNFRTQNANQEKSSSMYIKSIKANQDLYYKSDIEFFRYLSKENFFTIRNFYCGAMSFFILKWSFFKKNMTLLNKEFPAYKKSSFRHEWVIWYQFPSTSILVNSFKVLNFTLYNNSLQNDVYAANIIVKKYHDPLMKFIVKKYASKMNLELRLKLIISPIFTETILLIGRIKSIFKRNGEIIFDLILR